jgi:transcriptional regulator with XRE-family HTH domain
VIGWYNISYKGEKSDQLGRIYHMKDLINRMMVVSGSREAVARKLGISTSLLSMWFTGDRKPSDGSLKRIKVEYPELSSMVTVIHLERIS